MGDDHQPPGNQQKAMNSLGINENPVTTTKITMDDASHEPSTQLDSCEFIGSGRKIQHLLGSACRYLEYVESPSCCGNVEACRFVLGGSDEYMRPSSLTTYLTAASHIIDDLW